MSTVGDGSVGAPRGPASSHLAGTTARGADGRMWRAVQIEAVGLKRKRRCISYWEPVDEPVATASAGGGNLEALSSVETIACEYRGARLIVDEGNPTGYKGVYRNPLGAEDHLRPFQAWYKREIGWFATAVEAAFAYQLRVREPHSSTKPNALITRCHEAMAEQHGTPAEALHDSTPEATGSEDHRADVVKLEIEQHTLPNVAPPLQQAADSGGSEGRRSQEERSTHLPLYQRVGRLKKELGLESHLSLVETLSEARHWVYGEVAQTSTLSAVEQLDELEKFLFA